MLQEKLLFRVMYLINHVLLNINGRGNEIGSIWRGWEQEQNCIKMVRQKEQK